MTKKENPLQKYYRRVNTHVKLPSRGRFYKEGTVPLNEEGEVGIMPMTASDELALKNPDALFSGDAVIQVLKSCVPGITNVRDLLSCDIDVMMIGIREASYGEDATMAIDCPKCGKENSYALNLDVLLNQLEILEDSYEVVLDNQLTVFVRPGSLSAIIKKQKAVLETSKIERAIESDTLNDDQRMRLMSEAFKKLGKLNFDLIVDAIIKIIFTDENGEVVEVINKEDISDFVQNVSKTQVDKIEEKIVEVNSIGISKTMEALCVHCNHTWEAPIEFNPVNFS